MHKFAMTVIVILFMFLLGAILIRLSYKEDFTITREDIVRLQKYGVLETDSIPVGIRKLLNRLDRCEDGNMVIPWESMH